MIVVRSLINVPDVNYDKIRTGEKGSKKMMIWTIMGFK